MTNTESLHSNQEMSHFNDLTGLTFFQEAVMPPSLQAQDRSYLLLRIENFGNIKPIQNISQIEPEHGICPHGKKSWLWDAGYI